MAERPILFSPPMVRALLAGTKTQTRRLWKMPSGYSWEDYEAGLVKCDKRGPAYGVGCGIDEVRCPHGSPGDRLWVRETWALVPPTAYKHSDRVQRTDRHDNPYHHDSAVFRADWPRSAPDRWRPSIHIPRWASRITLERVERLQDISEVDAAAEGVQRDTDGWYDYLMPNTRCCPTARCSYRSLWQSINGLDSWKANPWVWVISFRRIDSAAAGG